MKALSTQKPSTYPLLSTRTVPSFFPDFADEDIKNENHFMSPSLLSRAEALNNRTGYCYDLWDGLQVHIERAL